MFGLPKTTDVHKILPKEAFYKNLDINTNIKDKFVSDIKQIIIVNALTADNTNLEKSGEITQILVLKIELKTKVKSNIRKS